MIRIATENDAEELLNIYVPYVEKTAITFEYEVPSVEEFRIRIRNILKKYPFELSGGMCQRVMIAIAICLKPTLLIADEPTTALDVTIQAQVLDLIEKLKADFNTSLLLITHDLGIVAEVCDKAAIMYAGRIVEYGNLEHIYNNTKHPYTVGLFGSIPNFDENVRRLKPIPGLMPDPTRLPEGCAFAPRCPHATDRCRQAPIPVVEVEPGHLVECVLFEQQGVAGA